jgi:hypothetical protein
MKKISYCIIEEDQKYYKYRKRNSIGSSLSSEKLITHNWSHIVVQDKENSATIWV